MTIMNFTIIRERVEEARSYLYELDSVVLTTFNFNADFFEENVLPTLLGVDAEAKAAQRAQLHERLCEVPVDIFFDPSVARYSAGDFRYLACPIVPGVETRSLFHPKNIILAGRDREGVSWVYVSVSSANLTLSGWGRNAEIFADTWIHTRKQQAWGELREFVRWLMHESHLETVSKHGNALTSLAAVLDDMPNEKCYRDREGCPWAGALHHRLYFSPLHDDGLAPFLRANRERRPERLVVFSPYWSDVNDVLESFDARNVELVPALLPREVPTIGLDVNKVEALCSKGIYRNIADGDGRFWHFKFYVLEMGARHEVGVGSCNFTSAGTIGAHGNVESMLAIEYGPNEYCEMLPDYNLLEDLDHKSEDAAEEDAPSPAPVSIVVFYNWKERAYLWWYTPRRTHRDALLDLPAKTGFRLKGGKSSSKSKRPPPKGGRFIVRYFKDDRPCRYEGRIVEVNLDHSTRTYGTPLTVEDIFKSWKGHRLPLGGGIERAPEDATILGDDDEEGDETSNGAFDAVNLYDMYRAFYERAAQLREHEAAGEERAVQAALTIRPDGAFALARLVAEDSMSTPAIRFLVLWQTLELFQSFRRLVPDGPWQQVAGWFTQARRELENDLRDDLRRSGSRAAPERAIAWFEDRLSNAWGSQ